MNCQLCGEKITNTQTAKIVLPWGETCSNCLEDINQLKEKSTYHGLIKVSCIVCDFVTSDVSEMEMLNDLDGNCPKCENKFFRWENKDGSVVVSYTDEEGNYDNLVMEVE